MDGADPGVLVRRSWAERVDAATDSSAKNAAADSVESSRASLFYDIRPIVLASDWELLGSGLRRADAFFVTKSTVDRSFMFDVYAITPTARPPAGTNSTLWAIWRGRWELLSDVNGNDFKYFRLKSGVGVGLYDANSGAGVNDTAGTGGYYEIRFTGVTSIGGASGNLLSGAVKTDTTFFTVTNNALSLATTNIDYVSSVSLPTFGTATQGGILGRLTTLNVTKNDAGVVTDVELVKHELSFNVLTLTDAGTVLTDRRAFVSTRATS